jgi:SAM-dependent methyltransferase
MKIYNAMSNWGKILLFCLLFLILVVLLNTVSMRRKLKEGYEQRDNEEKGEKFILKEGNDIYDDFYISIYDDLFYSSMKDDYEIGQIINKTEPTSESRILDIGSGIGHHVSKLEEQGYHAIGLDASEAMVKKAKETFPSSEFIVGDATGALNFQFNYFTHILCMYFTIYHIKNKEQFFNNVMNWLMPGGYFILHLVDRDNFDPILPAGQGFLIVSPQKYAKKRITKTKVHFHDFVYSADFDLNSSKNIAIFNEKFKFTNGSGVRKNQHILYIETADDILTIAQQCGFIIDGKIDLLKCGYDSQFLYILRKPA